MALFNFPLFLPINGLMMGGLAVSAPFSRRPRLGKSTTGALPVRAIAGVAFVVLALASGGAALGEAVGIPVPWDPRWVENRLSRADARLHPDPAEGRRPDPASARLLYEAVAEQFPERAEAVRIGAFGGRARIAAPGRRRRRGVRPRPSVVALARSLAVGMVVVLSGTKRGTEGRNRSPPGLGIGTGGRGGRSSTRPPPPEEGDPAGADRWLSGWWNRWGTPPAPSEPGSPYRQAILRRDAVSFGKGRSPGCPPDAPGRLAIIKRPSAERTRSAFFWKPGVGFTRAI